MTSIADVVHAALSTALYQAMGADQYDKLIADGVLRAAARNAASALAGDPVALLMTAVDALDSATSVWVSKFENGSRSSRMGRTAESPSM